MSKKILLAILLAAFGITTSVAYAFAEDITSTTGVTSTPTTTKVRGNDQATKDAFKQQLTEKREEMKTLMQDRKAAFQENVALIKDAKKKAAVERIGSKLTNVNLQRTNRMTEALTRLTTHLTRLEEKGAALKQNGTDTTAFDQAVADAKTAIEEATTLVNEQKEKDYTPTVTTETQLKTTVGQTVNTAQADLRATHMSVKEAKTAVIAVVIELAKLLGNKPMSNTDTASQSAN